MPYRRTCPVCGTPDSIIRPDVKTCSRECSRIWNKMARSEQIARMADVDPDIKLNKLKSIVKEISDHPEWLSEPVAPPPDPSLHIPKGILPEDPQPSLLTPIRKSDEND